ncbi:VirD4-like conjugal transfer protein, CD1115 family [Ligilactobacillus murinus]|uniref:VirD4-like conjugal transfer protein, CD1115 family n=2 Tax=Ligilactobacillus murinus TaxID=1622 RepID=UPI001440EB90|nr:type IV secretory system conjugative DNA transfer family protein [Ligilactobacillus murinus]
MIDVLINLLQGIVRVILGSFVYLYRSVTGNLFLSVPILILLIVLGYLGYLYWRNRERNVRRKKDPVLLEWCEKVLESVDETGNVALNVLLKIRAFVIAIVNVLGILLIAASVHALNKVPWWNRKRKKFHKEVKPKIRFKTWRSFVLMCVVFDILATLLTCYLTGIFREAIDTAINFSVVGEGHQFDLTYLYFERLFDFSVFVETPILAIPIEVVLCASATKASWVNWQQYRDYNNNEAGDDQFATLKEIKHQYVAIPDRAKKYKGVSGIPVAHTKAKNIQGFQLSALMLYNNKKFAKVMGEMEEKARLSGYKAGYYYIEQQTINVLLVGTTRSGKGEAWVNSSIEIITRAEDPSSLVVADPKLELNQMTYKTLRKRGYDVQVMSFKDMDFSMSYNPFALAIEAAKKGYYEKVQALVNSVSEAIYRSPKRTGGSQEYFENTSISLFNAIAIALIDRAAEAMQAGEDDAWDTVTIRNVVTMLTELGTEDVWVNSENKTLTEPEEGAIKKNKLTFYFDKLREANEKKYSKFREMADINYRTSDFAGGETRGTVYSSMLAGINLFLQDNIARLTSKNTIDLESFGNPRRLTIQFRSNSNVDLPNDYAFQRVTLNFYEDRYDRRGRKQKPKLLIKNARAMLDEAGYMTYIVKEKLPDNFKIVATFKDEINNAVVQDHRYRFEGEKVYARNKKGGFKYDKYTKQKELVGVDMNVLKKPKQVLLEKENIDFVYSEKPIALFIGLPPNKKEYGSLVALMVDQLFNANFDLALAAGRKNVRRIQFLFDEFANLPAIPDIARKLSLALGNNFQFMMFVQSLSQLVELYGKEVADTIIGNCSILGLIKTNSDETNVKFSKMLGKKTITERNKATNPLKEADPHINERGIAQDLMTPTQLATMEAGEAVLIRSVKAYDLQGHKVTNDPIRLMGETEMPMRYMLLKEEFDQKTTMADIAVKAEHSGLDLSEISIAPRKTIVSLEEWVNKLKDGKLDSPFPMRPTRKKKPAQNVSDLKKEMISKVG